MPTDSAPEKDYQEWIGKADVETRYPGEFPEFSWHECQQALESTEKIRGFVLGKVGE